MVAHQLKKLLVQLLNGHEYWREVLLLVCLAVIAASAKFNQHLGNFEVFSFGLMVIQDRICKRAQVAVWIHFVQYRIGQLRLVKLLQIRYHYFDYLRVAMVSS